MSADARNATGRIDGTDVLHFPPSVPLRSPLPVVADFAGNGPPKLEGDGSVIVDFPPHRVFQARLARPVIAINFEGLEGGALEWVPETSRDQEGAEVKAKVLAMGERADPNRLDAHDAGLCGIDRGLLADGAGGGGFCRSATYEGGGCGGRRKHGRPERSICIYYIQYS